VNQDPFERAKQIRAGELDDAMPAYEELTGWLQRVPATWLPGLLIDTVKQCVARKVFKDGGLERIVDASIKSAGPGCELRKSDAK
jgi:hypothetical protein